MPEDIETSNYGPDQEGLEEHVENLKYEAAGRIVKMNEWLESDDWVKDWLKENKEWLKNQDWLEEDVEDLEPADLSLEDKLKVTIKKGQEELEGVKDEGTLRAYVHGAHGEGKKSHYKDHPQVEKAAGHIGEYLTDKHHFYKVIYKKVFDQFLENIDSPEKIPSRHELAREIELPDSLKEGMDEDKKDKFIKKRIDDAHQKVRGVDGKVLERAKEKIEGRVDEEELEDRLKRTYKDFKGRTPSAEEVAADKKRVDAFANLTEVQNLLKKIKEEHPDASREKVLHILDDALESHRSTIRQQVKALKGEKGQQEYDKYSSFFPEEKDNSFPVKDSWRDIRKEIGYEAYNRIGSIKKDGVVSMLKEKLEGYDLDEDEVEPLAEFIYRKEKGAKEKEAE